MNWKCRGGENKPPPVQNVQSKFTEHNIWMWVHFKPAFCPSHQTSNQGHVFYLEK